MKKMKRMEVFDGAETKKFNLSDFDEENLAATLASIGAFIQDTAARVKHLPNTRLECNIDVKCYQFAKESDSKYRQRIESKIKELTAEAVKKQEAIEKLQEQLGNTYAKIT